jgi:6-phospho-3-hexuloisomerase
MTPHQIMAQATDELAGVAARIDADEIARAAELIASAGHVMLYGCGREGLQMQGLAMRLHHLGLNVSMQGDMAAPPLGPKDLFVASAGPGELSTVTALVGQARAAGAKVLILTAQPSSATPRLADLTLTIPAQTMTGDRQLATSLLPLGSLFEGALFVLFEALILNLIERLRVTPESLSARHTNME